MQLSPKVNSEERFHENRVQPVTLVGLSSILSRVIRLSAARHKASSIPRTKESTSKIKKSLMCLN